MTSDKLAKIPQKPLDLTADKVKSMERKDKESLSSCVKELTELAKRVTYWAESIESNKSYSSLNTLQLKFKVVQDRLRTILICMEASNLPTLAARLEREYGNLIKMTEYFDKLCKEPNHKNIKPGDLETAPQELQISAASFVSLLDEISNQILSAAEETIKPAEKPAETGGNAITAKIWTCIKRIPRWIYVLVIFLAALLGIFEKFGCLEPIKTFVRNILWPK